MSSSIRLMDISKYNLMHLIILPNFNKRVVLDGNKVILDICNVLRCGSHKFR